MSRGKIIRFPKVPPEQEGRGTAGRAGGDTRGTAGRAGDNARRDSRGFVEIYRCRDQSEAMVLKGLFESEDIPCLFRSRLAHSVHPFTVGDQGEVTILVPESDASRARLLVARVSPGPSFP